MTTKHGDFQIGDPVFLRVICQDCWTNPSDRVVIHDLRGRIVRGGGRHSIRVIVDENPCPKASPDVVGKAYSISASHVRAIDAMTLLGELA